MSEIKAYVTRYWETRGILEVCGSVSEAGYLHVKGHCMCYGNSEFYTSLSDAIKNAEQKKTKKIESLRKKISKLEKMGFQ